MKAVAGLLAGVAVLSLSGCSISEGRERAEQAQADAYMELGRAQQRFVSTLEDRFGVTIEVPTLEDMSASEETEWVVDGVERSCRLSSVHLTAEAVGLICEGKPLPEVKEMR